MTDIRSRADLRADGEAARTALPPADLGSWVPAPDRPDPVDLLEGQAATRFAQLVPVRYGRMAVSPFTFYRGAALPMAADLSAGPRTTIEVQLCGDAHLANFGGFAAPDRAIVFDMNDFDETNPGPFEWDVKRLATSFVLAARSLELAQKDIDAIARTSVSSYRKAMAEFADKRNLELWYARIDAQTTGFGPERPAA